MGEDAVPGWWNTTSQVSATPCLFVVGILLSLCDDGRFFYQGGVLFSYLRVLRRGFTLVRLIFACSDSGQGVLHVNVTRLFFRLKNVQRSFNASAYYARFYRGARERDHFLFARVSRWRFYSIRDFFQVGFRLIRRVRSAIYARESASAKCPQRARCSNRVIVTSATYSATSLCIRHLRFGGDPYVMIRSTNRYRIGFGFVLRPRYFRYVRGGLAFLRSLRSCFAN